MAIHHCRRKRRGQRISHHRKTRRNGALNGLSKPHLFGDSVVHEPSYEWLKTIAADNEPSFVLHHLLNPEQGQSPAERLNARDVQARAADFEFMRGDAEIPQNQAAE